MGLAQRFKDKLDRKNIFDSTSLEKDFEKQDIKFISKPITESITVQPKDLHSGVNEPVGSLTELKSSIKEPAESISLEDMETMIIEKIRKTPYWEEYSHQRQVNMIGSYFDKKYGFTSNMRQEFIKNVIALANNR